MMYRFGTLNSTNKMGVCCENFSCQNKIRNVYATCRKVMNKISNLDIEVVNFFCSKKLSILKIILKD